jgi:hypothetical protein
MLSPETFFGSSGTAPLAGDSMTFITLKSPEFFLPNQPKSKALSELSKPSTATKILQIKQD